MGTSSSSSGPKGQTPLLPSWATEESDSSHRENDQSSVSDSKSNNQYYSLTSVKGSLTRIVKNIKGASYKSALRSYVKKTGGYKSSTLSSKRGIASGNDYLGFFTSASREGLEHTLEKYGLSDCIGKSTEEAFAKIANKIAPIGSTNDEAISRLAVMMALDKLYEKFVEDDKDINSLDHLDEETLKEIVIEFVSAYIYEKWVYEAGLALERNNLSESQAIELENEIHIFITGEVRSGLEKVNILSFDIKEGDGRKIIEDIFDIAYSTLEK